MACDLRDSDDPTRRTRMTSPSAQPSSIDALIDHLASAGFRLIDEDRGGMGGVRLIYRGNTDGLSALVEITADRGQWQATLKFDGMRKAVLPEVWTAYLDVTLGPSSATYRCAWVSRALASPSPTPAVCQATMPAPGRIRRPEGAVLLPLFAVLRLEIELVLEHADRRAAGRVVHDEHPPPVDVDPHVVVEAVLLIRSATARRRVGPPRPCLGRRWKGEAKGGEVLVGRVPVDAIAFDVGLDGDLRARLDPAPCRVPALELAHSVPS